MARAYFRAITTPPSGPSHVVARPEAWVDELLHSHEPIERYAPLPWGAFGGWL